MKKELLIASALVSTLGVASVANAVTATMSGGHHAGLKGSSTMMALILLLSNSIASQFLFQRQLTAVL